MAAAAEAEAPALLHRGLKRNYRCVQSLQQFYNGRPFTISSDASFLACVCDDKIKIVNACNSSVRAVLEGDTEAVTALALSPDDKFLFSASHSRLIRVWDISTSKCVRSWKVIRRLISYFQLIYPGCTPLLVKDRCPIIAIIVEIRA